MSIELEDGNPNGAMKAQGSALSERAPMIEAAEVVLRFLVSVLSIAGLILLLKDQQTAAQEIGDQTVVSELKYSYISAGFEYVAYSNGLVSFYCFVMALTSTFSIIGTARSGKPGAWIIFILDQGFAYILLSAASASSEVADLAETGVEKTSWEEVCSVFGHFCLLLRASIVVTFLSTLLLAVISVISAHQLFRQYRLYKAVPKV